MVPPAPFCWVSRPLWLLTAPENPCLDVCFPARGGSPRQRLVSVDARGGVHVVPAVSVQGGAALAPLCGEAGLGRDAARCCIRKGMHEIEAVEADLAERPGGQRR